MGAADLAPTIRSAAAGLAAARPRVSGVRALVGFDGFVDEIISVVDKRTGPDDYTPVRTIADLGRRIGAAAGLSTNIELVPRQVKLGGNGPIMAHALVCAGMAVTYVGSVGLPDVHPVFADLAARARVISIAEPGHTDALEFADGKVMLGKLEALKQVNWSELTRRLPAAELRRMLATSDLVAMVNWTMLPFMSTIWAGLLAEVLPGMEGGERRAVLFVDLADPEKRSADDIRAAMEMLARFRPYFRTFLGLNRKEATEVAHAVGIEECDPAGASLAELTPALVRAIRIDGVVVHPTEAAAVFSDGHYAELRGPYTPTPRLTTGAGDNFNAGFCLGLVLDMAPRECLALGKATSGYYVRQAHSPSLDQLIEFLHRWAARPNGEL